MDRQSGKYFNRIEYKKIIKSLKKGGILIIKGIDSLGKNSSKIIDEWRKITKIKSADIIFQNLKYGIRPVKCRIP